MAATANRAWPLPDGTSVPNVPYWFSQLGNAIDAEHADTGWLNVPTAGGFTAMTGSEAPQVRLRHGVIYTRGGWTGAGMTANTVHTVVAAGGIPASCRPPASGSPVLTTSGSSAGSALASLHIFNDGSVQVRTGATVGGYYKMDGRSFLADS